jgi:hypothetical protein
MIEIFNFIFLMNNERLITTIIINPFFLCFCMAKAYRGKTKKVEIDGREREAFFPSEHSNLSGVSCETYDKNAGDSYANIRDWHTTLYVLHKGSKEWQEVYSGPPANSALPIGKGLFAILHSFEDPDVRARIELEEHRENVDGQIRKYTEEKRRIDRELRRLQKAL